MESTRLPTALERPNQTFSSRAVDVLREMILDGSLGDGERLNEVELANALGISRGPLREAIQRLSSEGLLTSVSGRGAFVRTFTTESLKDLYEVRIALETHAVRLAAGAAAAADIAELQGMLEQTRQALADDSAYPESLDFHQRIVALSGSQGLVDAAREVHQQSSLARSRSGHLTERAHQALDDHLAVLEQLKAGRGGRAAQLLEQHLRGSLRSALEVLRTAEAQQSSTDGSGVLTVDSSQEASIR